MFQKSRKNLGEPQILQFSIDFPRFFLLFLFSITKCILFLWFFLLLRLFKQIQRFPGLSPGLDCCASGSLNFAKKSEKLRKTIEIQKKCFGKLGKNNGNPKFNSFHVFSQVFPTLPILRHKIPTFPQVFLMLPTFQPNLEIWRRHSPGRDPALGISEFA